MVNDSGTYADGCDDGPYLFDDSVAGLDCGVRLQQVRTDIARSGTNADELDDGLHLFDNSVADLTISSDLSMCVRKMILVGQMLTGATVALTCSGIRMLA
jgi:hypothetical protein